MEDLSKRIKMQRSFNENSMAPLHGSGLKRSGAACPTGSMKCPTGFIMPAPEDIEDSGVGPIASALLPVVSAVATQAAPTIWKGIKAVGKWFGRLFRRRRHGRGLTRSGGLRDPRESMFLSDPNYLNGSYHDAPSGRSGFKMDYLAEPGVPDSAWKKYQKALKQSKKLEGGLKIDDVPQIIELLKTPGFKDSIRGFKKKPHKILNFITRTILAAKKNNPAL